MNRSAHSEESAHPIDTIVLAGGCFWCVEAVFQRVAGVAEATSGYTGDDAETANYRDVCSGATNHAEAVQVRFHPDEVSLEAILEIFLTVAHDPTQRDRQGPDVGRQYRSAIFFADAEQRERAERMIAQFDQSGLGKPPIVTTLEPLAGFFPAEDYHQDYAQENPRQPYIACHVPPKLDKLYAGYPNLWHTDKRREE